MPATHLITRLLVAGSALIASSVVAGAQSSAPPVSPSAADRRGVCRHVQGLRRRMQTDAIHEAAGHRPRTSTRRWGWRSSRRPPAGFSARSGRPRRRDRRGAQSLGRHRPAGLPHRFAEERPEAVGPPIPASGRRRGWSSQAPSEEPLTGLQWDMQMIGANADGAHRRATGRGVDVGIIDTGVDASHPDIAPNFDTSRSRNFTMDIPSIDGPCEVADLHRPGQRRRRRARHPRRRHRRRRPTTASASAASPPTPSS